MTAPYVDSADFASTGLQAFLDAVVASRLTGVLRPSDWAIVTPLRITNARNLRIIGLPTGETDAVRVYWNGPDGGTALYLNGVRDSEFEGFSVLEGNGKLDMAIQMDRTNDVQIESTYNTFRRLHLMGNKALAWTGQNGNDLHSVENCKVTGDGGEAGFSFENPETKGVRFSSTEVHGRQYGIHVAKDGVGFSWFAGGFDACSVILQVDGSGDPLLIEGAQDENCQQLLCGQGGGIVSIVSCRMDTNKAVSDWLNFKGGLVRLQGNDFCSGVNRPNVRFTVTNGWLVSEGNIYPNASPWTNLPTSSIADLYQSGSGLKPLSAGSTPPSPPSGHVGCLLALPLLVGRVLLKG